MGKNGILNVVDVFSGTGSVSAPFKRAGHNVLTIDWEPSHGADICDDIMNITAQDILDIMGVDHIDYVHMSPDCSTYSVAALGKHRNGIEPKSEKAMFADRVLDHIIKMLAELKPKYYSIENPRGMLRNMPPMANFSRHTITYCQYGDSRMKPTDIWHNIPTLSLKPPCKNGDTCHTPSPRGSCAKGSTQGMTTTKARARMPEQLCNDIYNAVTRACNGGEPD